MGFASIDLAAVGLALAAGLVAAFNPCGFAMLPAYLTLVVAGDTGVRGDGPSGGTRGRASAVARALTATAAMAIGFVLVFGAFGLVVAPLAASAQRFMPIVTVLVGLVLLALGGWMLSGRELTVLLPRPNGAPTARLGSMLGYGMAYALASLSCTIGPFLAVTSMTFRGGSVLGGLVAYVAYGLGMAIVVGVLAVAVALASDQVVRGSRRLLPYLNRVAGGLLLVVGAYVGYYGSYELRLYFAGASPDDPVIGVATAIQQRVVAWVSELGVLPLAVLLVALVAIVLVTGRLTRRAVRDRRHPDGTEAQPAGGDDSGTGSALESASETAPASRPESGPESGEDPATEAAGSR